MGNFRLVTVMILACILSTPLTISQLVNGQSFTTMTIVQEVTSTAVTAVTSSVTSTIMTPQNVRYDLTPSSFDNKTGTFTLGYSDMTFVSNSNPDVLCLMYDYFLLNATTAYEFHIHFQTQDGRLIHFLILNADQFKRFNHTNCGNGNFGWTLQVYAPEFDQDWVVPQSGVYALLFLSGLFFGGYIQLSVQAYGQIVQMSTLAYTANSTIVLLNTQMMTSTLPSMPSPATNNFALIVAAIIITLIAIASALILRMRRRTS